ncbi:MAG: hypothetical protein Q4A75_05555 [Peptostreptococcaceae bacterium]|nr:hypothetical protein [Peptostreptococcaceae bacterium]
MKEYVKEYTMEEKKEMVLNYMQEKYGEEFVGKAYNRAEIMKPYDVFYVYPKEKGEKSWIKVIGDYEEGEYVLIDGYFNQLIEERYTEYMDNLFDKVFDKYYFTVRIDRDKAYSSQLHKDIPIEEIAKNMKGGAHFSPYTKISIPVSELQSVSDTGMWEIGNKLGEICLEKNLYFDLDLMVVKDEKFEEYVQHEGNVMHGILRDDYTRDLDKYYELEQERREEYFAYLDEEGKPWYNIGTVITNDKGEISNILKLYVNKIKVKGRNMNE